MRKKSPYALAFLLAAQATGVAGAAPPKSAQVVLPGGSTTVSCEKLGPEGKITLDFLEQLHTSGHDGFDDYIRKNYDNLSVEGAAAMINHLLTHGVPGRAIIKALQDCGANHFRVRQNPDYSR